MRIESRFVRLAGAFDRFEDPDDRRAECGYRARDYGSCRRGDRTRARNANRLHNNAPNGGARNESGCAQSISARYADAGCTRRLSNRTPTTTMHFRKSDIASSESRILPVTSVPDFTEGIRTYIHTFRQKLRENPKREIHMHFFNSHSLQLSMY